MTFLTGHGAPSCHLDINMYSSPQDKLLSLAGSVCPVPDSHMSLKQSLGSSTVVFCKEPHVLRM